VEKKEEYSWRGNENHTSQVPFLTPLTRGHSASHPVLSKAKITENF
jgi:hypothetical protein